MPNTKKAVNRGVLAGLGGLAMLVATACGQQDADVKNQDKYNLSTQGQINEESKTPKPESIETTLKTWEGYINNQKVTNFTEGILLKSQRTPGTNLLLPRKQITHVLDTYGNVVQYVRDEANTYDSKVEDLWERAFARLQRIDIFGPDGRKIASYALRVDWTSDNPKPEFTYQSSSGVFDQNSVPSSVRTELDALLGQFRAMRPEIRKALEGPIRTDETPLTPYQKPSVNSPQKGGQKIIV